MALHLKQGSDPFDKVLIPERPLDSLWLEAEPFSNLSPRYGKRYHGQDNLLLHTAIGSNDWDEAQAQIDEAEDHFNRLRQFGMHVVSHCSEVHENPRELEEDPTQFTIISAAKYISQCRSLNSPSAANVPAQEVLNDLVMPLSKYLSWVQAEKPPNVLSEIYTIDQYSWQQGSKMLFLHDIDPALRPNDNSVTNEIYREAVLSFMRIAPTAAIYL